MGLKQLYNDNLRKLPKEYGDVSVTDESCIPKVFITFFSRTARHKKMKQYKVTNMKNKYSVLGTLKSGCSYFFIPLFLPFSPIFSLYYISFSSDSAIVGL